MVAPSAVVFETKEMLKPCPNPSVHNPYKTQDSGLEITTNTEGGISFFPISHLPFMGLSWNCSAAVGSKTLSENKPQAGPCVQTA